MPARKSTSRASARAARAPVFPTRYDAVTLAAIRYEVIRQADAAHSQYPQYAGHWDGPEWFVVRIKKTIRTKLGVAFDAGELTLAKVSDLSKDFPALGLPSRPFVSAYSIQNRIDTSVAEADVERLG